MLTCARSEMQCYGVAAGYVLIYIFTAFTTAFSMRPCTFLLTLVLALRFQSYFINISALVRIFRRLKQVLWVLWYISATAASFAHLMWFPWLT